MCSFVTKFWTRLTDRGFFALGLVVGVSALLIFELLLFEISPTVHPETSNPPHKPTESIYDAENNQEKPNWYLWPRRLVRMEDTIAQWFMMFFAAGAFYILIHTLKATQAMATDARDVGKAQVRAYLSLKIGDVIIDNSIAPKKTRVTVEVTIVNSGNSTAHNVRVAYYITYVQKDEVTQIIGDVDSIGHVGNPIPVVPPQSSGQKASLSRTMTKLKDRTIRFIYMIEYQDVFGDKISTQIFSGTLVEYPKGTGVFVFVNDIIREEQNP